MKILQGSPKFFKLQGVKKDTPLYLMLNLESGCSYKCVKCALPGYRCNMKDSLTLAQRQRIMSLAHEIGIKSLVVIGRGEPTEYFSLMKPIIETANTYGFVTIMFTNASNLDREQAKFYQSHNVSLIVSLDSINKKTYKELTGNGDLIRVLKNIELLRSAYRKQKDFVRLGINVTVTKQNQHELDAIKEFAGDDIFFVANPPIKIGKLQNPSAWKELVGNTYEELNKVAKEKSETSGQSSLEGGICSYFYRGISVDVDGALLSCGYATESSFLGDATNATAEELLKHYHRIRKGFKNFLSEIKQESIPCPLRSDLYHLFLEELRNE
ncbi:MAG: radical SAM protein [bacterium]|nr:radical SAM protein [bacterium]